VSHPDDATHPNCVVAGGGDSYVHRCFSPFHRQRLARAFRPANGLVLDDSHPLIGCDPWQDKDASMRIARKPIGRNIRCLRWNRAGAKNKGTANKTCWAFRVQHSPATPGQHRFWPRPRSHSTRSCSHNGTSPLSRIGPCSRFYTLTCSYSRWNNVYTVHPEFAHACRRAFPPAKLHTVPSVRARCKTSKRKLRRFPTIKSGKNSDTAYSSTSPASRRSRRLSVR
jgi:hypothetical protein